MYDTGLYTAGCTCHIIHNIASYASKGLADSTKFCVDELIIDTYYFFDKSTKRQSALKQVSKTQMTHG